MTNFEPFDFAPLLRPEGFCCSCGRVHRADIRLLAVGPDILPSLPDQLDALSFARPFIVADANTYAAVGERVCRILNEKEIPYGTYVFPYRTSKLQPDEKAVQTVTGAFDPACDLILAAGSGTIGDICKAAATKLRIPQITVGSAPSMDGYTSASSSLELNHTKSSIPENAPIGVICDTAVMAEAPLRLIHAGIGDVLAKAHSLIEWKIAARVRGEEYCARIAALVRQAYERVANGMESAVRREEPGIRAVIEGLLLSGVCMTLVGTSRPASGQEHYFSHCWEMMAIARGEEYDLHGIYVGVGTILALRILEKLITLHPTLEHAEAAAELFNEAAWETRLRRVFGQTAESFIALEKKTQKNEKTRRMQRVRKILENWDELVRLIREDLPDIEALEEKMRRIGMPTRPADIGLSEQDVLDAFVCSRDTRDKYLTSSLIWDLGYMDEFEAWLIQIL
ncbi:MAG: iron-containing alcohol dehydrogenase [Firmicutes bacterium]|nr:iron-containing alcohol dehydrogenase [Bacillota bacterium]